MAAEIDAMFEEKRRDAGLRYEESLLASNDNTGFVARTGQSSIASVGSEPTVPSPRKEERPAEPTLSAIPAISR